MNPFDELVYNARIEFVFEYGVFHAMIYVRIVIDFDYMKPVLGFFEVDSI